MSTPNSGSGLSSGQQADSSMVDHRSAPPPDNTNVAGQDPNALYTQVQSAEPGQVGQVAQSWTNIGDALDTVNQVLSTGASTGANGWTGTAATNALQFHTQVAKWTAVATQASYEAGGNVSSQSSAASNAKYGIPKPMNYGLSQAIADFQANPFNIGAIQNKLNQAQQNHQQIANVVQQYDSSLHQASQQMPALGPTPSFTGSGNGGGSGGHGTGGGSGGGQSGVVGRSPGGGGVGGGQSPRQSGGGGGGGTTSPGPVSPGPIGGGSGGGGVGSPGPVPVGGQQPGPGTGLSGAGGAGGAGFPGGGGNLGAGGQGGFPGTGGPGGGGMMPLGPMGAGGFGSAAGGGGTGGRSAGGRGGAGFGGGASGVGGAGAASGVGDGAGGSAAGARSAAGAMSAAEEAAATRAAAGAPGQSGMGPMGAGAGRKGADDEEHRRPSYLVEADPDSIFGADERTAPPVIGEE